MKCAPRLQILSLLRDNEANFVQWTADQLQWYIDSQLVRTLPYAAANGGNNYPQTPMTVRIGISAGGDPSNSNGTIEWAGGLTNYSQGPYTMYVQSATVNDYSTGSAYEYTDHTGSWQSIKAIPLVIPASNLRTNLLIDNAVETQQLPILS